jgi:hypothetical protein
MSDWEVAGIMMHSTRGFGWILVAVCLADQHEVAEAQQLPKASLVATASLPGDTRDRTGWEGTLEEGTPIGQLGGFSAIEKIPGSEGLSGDARSWIASYWVLSDRGPADGAASYPCRVHQLRLQLDRQNGQLTASVIDTLPLTREGKPCLGALQALTPPGAPRGQALDPEGLRIGPQQSLWISEEYGPSVDRFDGEGRWVASLPLPPGFPLYRGDDLASATEGTVPNRGLEGLAVSADGKRLTAIMQGPLVQDSQPVKDKRYGKFVRVLHWNLQQPDAVPVQQLYPLEDRSCGISEILAVDEDRFLILERDGEAGAEAKYKRIYLADFSSASPVQSIDRLDPWTKPESLQIASKRLVIDLLDPAYGFNGQKAPEKPEGLAWHPSSDPTMRTLIVSFDNDFEAVRESLFMAFDIPESLLAAIPDVEASP